MFWACVQGGELLFFALFLAWWWKWSELSSGWPLRQVCTLEGHWGIVFSVAFSPDAKWIVSGANDDLVKIWNAETGAEVNLSQTWLN